jgi:hypothetical protein
VADVRERYEGVVAGKDKALRAQVKKSEALQAQLAALQKDLTVTLQTDRMQSLENAK